MLVTIFVKKNAGLPILRASTAVGRCVSIAVGFVDDIRFVICKSVNKWVTLISESELYSLFQVLYTVYCNSETDRTPSEELPCLPLICNSFFFNSLIALIADRRLESDVIEYAIIYAFFKFFFYRASKYNDSLFFLPTWYTDSLF